MTDGELRQLEELCDVATPGPWETSVSPTTTIEEAIEHMAMHLRAAPGVEVFGVWCPEHEGTVIGEDRAKPVHAVHAAKTGNGPTSAANADFIAAARSAVPLLIAEVRRQRELAKLILQSISLGNYGTVRAAAQQQLTAPNPPSPSSTPPRP